MFYLNIKKQVSMIGKYQETILCDPYISLKFVKHGTPGAGQQILNKLSRWLLDGATYKYQGSRYYGFRRDYYFVFWFTLYNPM